jgi:hypothetical protein
MTEQTPSPEAAPELESPLGRDVPEPDLPQIIDPSATGQEEIPTAPETPQDPVVAAPDADPTQTPQEDWKARYEALEASTADATNLFNLINQDQQLADLVVGHLSPAEQDTASNGASAPELQALRNELNSLKQEMLVTKTEQALRAWADSKPGFSPETAGKMKSILEQNQNLTLDQAYLLVTGSQTPASDRGAPRQRLQASETQTSTPSRSGQGGLGDLQQRVDGAADTDKAMAEIFKAFERGDLTE